MEDTNMTAHNNDALLIELNSEEVKRYAPITAYIAIVIVLGIVGNTMTSYFYGWKIPKTTNTVLIFSLATVDLVTCVIFVDELIMMCFPVKFTSIEACRFIHFTNHWFVCSSILVLWVICIDRYRKICRYFGWQFTITSAKVAVVVVIGVQLLLSVPHLFTFAITPVNLTDSHGHSIHGYVCSRSLDKPLQIILSVFHIIDLIIIVVVVLTFVVLYSLIVTTILVSKRNVNRFTIRYSSTTGNTSLSDNVEAAVEDPPTVIPAKVLNEKKHTDIKKTKKSVSSCGPRARNPIGSFNENFHAEVKITLMMIAITIGYFVCFVPYFFVSLGGMPGSKISDRFGIARQLIRRSYMLNSAINPYIIGVFNKVFRKFVVRAFCRCCYKKGVLPKQRNK